MSNLRTSVLLDLAGNLQSKARSYSGALESMSRRGKRSLGVLRRSTQALGRGLDSLGNKYTALLTGAGAAYKGYQAVVESGQLDKKLIRTKQTAGATAKATALLRKELHRMSIETGKSVDSLLIGFNNLIQDGLSWDAAAASITGVNIAMAVTDAEAQKLSKGLTVAANAFEFDLSEPGLALELLDKMTVAGRAGSAELENLASIFSRVGVNAKAAGFDFEGTLGFLELLSKSESNPEKLATLADSTMRLFTNQNYLRKAAKATKVKFYDGDGQKRAAFDVFKDIAAKYRNMTSDLQRDKFMNAAFGGADLDTIKGLRIMLKEESLELMRTYTQRIRASSGLLRKEMGESLDNAIDQSARLKAVLSDAADGFAQPINAAVKGAIKYLLDNKQVSGEEMLVGGTVATVAGLGLAKLTSGLILRKMGGALKSGLGGLLSGASSGPIPVYVVNDRMSMMPGEYGGGWQNRSSKAGKSASRRGSRFSRARNSASRFGSLFSRARNSASRFGSLFSRVGKWGNRAGGPAALLGTIYSLYKTATDNTSSTAEKIASSGQAVGSGLAGWGGAIAGAELGAVVGSIVPGLGTAIGAAIGGVGGGIAGAWAGGNVGERLAEILGQLLGVDADGQRPEGKLRIEVSDNRTRVTSLTAQGMEIDVDAGPYMAEVAR